MPDRGAERRPGPGDRPDLRRTLRGVAGPRRRSHAPGLVAAQRMRKRPLVIVADVSGSMERYTEMFLYFIHAAQGRLGRVEAFVFSTRLSRITRSWRQIGVPTRPPRAVATRCSTGPAAPASVRSFATFNLSWRRRVLAGGAVVLLVSDGWDRGDPERLAAEMAHLRRSCHRMIWLNPLLARPATSR